MNYLVAENLTKSYGEKLLFEDISFSIEQGQKIALIAKNGAGKSSLLNILMGFDIPDNGKVSIHKNIKISYLKQGVDNDNNNTINEIIYNSDNQYLSALREYNKCLEQISSENKTKETEKALEEAISKMDNLNAWDYENKVKEILSRFKINDLNQLYKNLSGGQKKKVSLAKALIEQADLLFLDEPTNHLDISMIEWLENYLAKQKQSLLLVTHDRYFLDNVCNEIIELDDYKLFRYKGNFEYFLKKKAERKATEEQKIEKAKNLYKKELEWINRQPQARATKSKARIDAFKGLKEQAFKKIDEPKTELKINMSRIGKKILEIKNVSKAYDHKNIITDFSYIFKRGERIGIVGENGVGKSTLLNLITGDTTPDKGEVVVGQTINFGYYNQNGIFSPEDKRVIDIVKDIAEKIEYDKKTISASVFLSYFNFSDTLQYNFYSNLSGGEKRRLYLLITLLKNPNFLILDEPTNDLDILTLSMLEEFLKKYQGCLMIVSHDRHLLDNMVDHIFSFEGNGKIKDYPGNYSYYKEKKAIYQSITKQSKQTKKEKKPVAAKQNNKPTYKQKQEFETLSQEIDSLETEKKAILENLNNGTQDVKRLQELSGRYQEIEKLLEIKSDRWLELSEIM